IWSLFQQNGLDLFQLLASHHSMCAAADRQLVLRLWNIHFFEENVRHGRVVMLPSVDDGLFHPAISFDSARHGRRFDELGPGTQDGGHGFHAAAFLAQVRVSSTSRLSTWSSTARWRAYSSMVLCHSRVKQPFTRWQACINRSRRAWAAAVSRARMPPITVDSMTIRGRNLIFSASPRKGSNAVNSWQVPQRKPG